MATLSRLAFAFGAPALIMASVTGVVWLSAARFDTVIGPTRPILYTPPLSLSPSSLAPSDLSPPIGPDSLDAPPPNADEAVPAWQAQLRNALLPYSKAPHLAGARFSAIFDKEAPAQALQCLTSAVYYEATGEPDAGKRAVAQVVVNRWASSLFPKTICGVVGQGAPAPGCQFSFMCDGALGRRPSPNAWADAETIARAALNGYVETSVGAATHYHADYVVPVWAPTMLKLVKLGRHIFYRWPGAAAFVSDRSAAVTVPTQTIASVTDTAANSTHPAVAQPPPASPPPTAQAPRDAGLVAAPKPEPSAPPPASRPEPIQAPIQAPRPIPEPPHRAVPPPSLRVGPI
jgi:hypothetical protein